MHALSTYELLNVWDQGRHRSPIQRVLTLLAAACPDTTSDVLSHLSIGARDAYLLRLRELTFGPQLVALSDCPECRERLELTFNISDIMADPGNEAAQYLSLSVADYKLSFRLPNSQDVESLPANCDHTDACQLLLERCIVDAKYKGKERGPNQLPVEVITAITEQMAQRDPQADVQLSLCCSSCGHRWQVPFDIVSFFLNEIDIWAIDIIRHVHILAFAYGWSEAEVLHMSPYRRQLYLEMVKG